jgi:hypothetical protein
MRRHDNVTQSTSSTTNSALDWMNLKRASGLQTVRVSIGSPRFLGEEDTDPRECAGARVYSGLLKLDGRHFI